MFWKLSQYQKVQCSAFGFDLLDGIAKCVRESGICIEVFIASSAPQREAMSDESDSKDYYCADEGNDYCGLYVWSPTITVFCDLSSLYPTLMQAD